MLYCEEDADPAKILNWVANTWLVVTIGFLLVGYIGVIFAADSISQGMRDLGEVLKRMTGSSVMSFVIILAPGVVGKIVAAKLAKRRNDKA